MSNEITDALGTVSTALTQQVNVGAIAAVIGVVIAAALGIYLFWFGARKLFSGVKNAMKGRLSI